MVMSSDVRPKISEVIRGEEYWPAPVLPLKRRRDGPDGPEVGVVLPQFIVKLYALPELPKVVVVKENMFMLRASTLLATPRDVYSTSDEAEEAGWIVD